MMRLLTISEMLTWKMCQHVVRTKQAQTQQHNKVTTLDVQKIKTGV